MTRMPTTTTRRSQFTSRRHFVREASTSFQRQFRQGQALRRISQRHCTAPALRRGFSSLHPWPNSKVHGQTEDGEEVPGNTRRVLHEIGLPTYHSIQFSKVAPTSSWPRSQVIGRPPIDARYGWNLNDYGHQRLTGEHGQR